MTRQYNRLYKSFFGIGVLLMCILLLPSLRILPVGAQAQPVPGTGREQELESRIDAFFGTLSRGNSDSAFNELLRMSPLVSSGAVTQMNALRNRVDELKRFGEILSWERYETKQIGIDVSVVRYVLKYESHPVNWTFVFYRKPPSASSTAGSNPWVVIELHFDTSFL